MVNDPVNKSFYNILYSLSIKFRCSYEQQQKRKENVWSTNIDETNLIHISFSKCFDSLLVDRSKIDDNNITECITFGYKDMNGNDKFYNVWFLENEKVWISNVLSYVSFVM